MKKFFIKDLANMVEKEIATECQIVDRGWPALAGPYAQ
jgi:hypothetical protein